MDFLRRVLSDEGYICVCGFKGQDIQQQFVQTFDEAEAILDKFDSEERNIYFGCARYTKEERNLQTVKDKKIFYIDIDCGASKPYANQSEAASALREFVTAVKLPRPTLVNSGNGLHVYWVLEEAIPPREWLATAQALKELCKKHKLKADGAVTANNAAILRMPGYFNRKTDVPVECNVIFHSKPIKFSTFKDLVGAINLGPESASTVEENAYALESNFKSVFKNVLPECKQLKYCFDNQSQIDYTLWRASESIVKYCIDNKDYIHTIAKDHPHYVRHETEKLVAGIKGPYKCITFEGLNPDGCKDCKHKGKITSPIQLGGKVFVEKKVEQLNAEIKEKQKTLPVVVADQVPTLETLPVPELPYPFKLGNAGGIHMQLSEDEEEQETVLVYEHDLFLLQRYKDPLKGEVVLMRHVLPKDGEQAVILAAKEIVVGDEAKKILAHYGVLANRKQMDRILNYIISSFKNLQHIQEAIEMRLQFGWADNDTRFILGEKEINADTVMYCPPSSSVEKFAGAVKAKGSLDEWKKIVGTYGKYNMHPQAFAFMTGFGSPLLKFLHYEGAIINLVNNKSGTGKTTALKMALSVWGNPKQLLFIKEDTQNAKIHTIGVFNSLPVAIDEVTNMTGEAFSDVVFSLTQGRGKARMEKSSNSVRLNATKWSTIGVTTSNSSMVDKLRATKQTPDGELMRFIEFDVPQKSPISKQEANKIFDEKVAENYGLAGPLYAQYLIKNQKDVIEELHKIQKFIDKKVGFSSRERFWSAIIACNITGANIAKKMGLLPVEFDIGAITNWVCDSMKKMREEIQAPSNDHSATIGDFINENRNSILVVNGDTDRRSMAEHLPIVIPRSNKICVRIEPDTKLMYVTSKYLKQYCSENQITLRDVLDSLKELGAFRGSTTKRIDRGLDTVTPAVCCYEFDCTVNGFIDLGGYISELENDSSTD